MVMSGVFALIAALQHRTPTAIAALLAFGAGASEWQGAKHLREGRASGVSWMVAGELALLVVILAYSAWMMTHFNYHEFITQIPQWQQDKLFDDLRAQGATEAEIPDLFRVLNAMVYGVLSFVSVFYQGGFALYYHRRRGPITVAMTQLPNSR